MTDERVEALMRIVVGFVSGIILGLWLALIKVVVIIHLLVALFTDTRNKELANFCEIFNSQGYTFVRYMTFVSNDRPFPFEPLAKNISKFK